MGLNGWEFAALMIVLVSIFFTLAPVREAFFRAGRWFNRVTGLVSS